MVRKLIIYLVLILLFPFILFSQITDYNYNYGSLIYDKSEQEYLNGLIKKSEDILFEYLNQYKDNVSLDKSQILRAKIDYNQGNYTLAFNQLGNFVKKRSNSPLIPLAEFLRGLISIDLKKYIDAEYSFELAIVYSESDIKDRDSVSYSEIAHLSNFWLGIALSKQGRHQEAIQPFLKSSFTYPDGIYADDALFNVGRIYELNNQNDSAIYYFRLVNQKYPFRNNFIASLVAEASNLLSQRQPSGALLALNQAETTLDHIVLKDSIGNRYETQNFIEEIRDKILYLRGESYNIAGIYTEAEKVFKFFLDTYDDSEYINLIRLGYGWALLNNGKNEEALEQYLKIIEKEENNPSRILTIAQLYKTIALKRKGEVDKAKNLLLELSSQPAYPLLGNVLLELGQIYYEEYDYDAAIKTLERAAIETQDGRILVRINLLLGAAYMERNLWDRATKEYKKAIQLAENSNEILMPKKQWYLSEANLKLGICLIRSMRSAEAISNLQYFIANSKNDNRMDEAIFWLAEAFYKNDLLRNAIDNYSKILNNFPASNRKEETLYGIGWSHFRLREFDKSSFYFEALVREFPNSKYAVEVLTRQGDGFYISKNFRQAANFYERAANIGKGTEEGHYAAYQLANAQYRMGANEQAISSLLKFVKLYNKSRFAPNALYLVGWIRFQERKYKEAIDNFKFMIDAYSQSTLVPRAYYAVGDCYYNMGDYETAINYYKIVIENYPGSELAPEAIKSVQYSLMALGRETEAIDIANKYVATNPESPFAPVFQKKIGEMFFQGKKYNDAITEFQKFIEKHPTDENTPEVMYLMAKSHINLNNPEKAIEIFDAIQRTYPKSEWAPMAMLEKGLLYLDFANINKADSILAEMTVKYPQSELSAQAGFERAIIRYRRGDTTSAIELFREVKRIFPETDWGDQSIYRIAMHYRANGQYDSARYYFSIISDIKENPKISSEARYRIGELYLRDKDYEKAIENFLIVKNNYEGYEDWYSLALLNLGEAYEKTNNNDLARDIYNTLQILRPDDDFGKTAKSRLKRMKR